jgi:hypothetical protein
MGKMRNVYKVLIGKPKEKKPLERSKCKWDDNIKMYLVKNGV